ncbi:MAG: hypothetical protein ABI537_08240 [Casimicrobiaceae bacterium]
MFASVALADGNDMTALTPAQSAQMKSERDAAKAKWAAMTPAEKTAVTQSMRNKKLKDLSALELVAQNDDMTAMTKAETATLKSEREAAQAKYTKMTAGEKAALRKSAQQKRLADLNAMERTNQSDDMGRYMSY